MTGIMLSAPASNNPFNMSTECHRVILKVPRSKTQHYNLNFPSGGYALELLSAKEAKELQEALLIEFCTEHGMFHCIADPTDCFRWIHEFRRA